MADADHDHDHDLMRRVQTGDAAAFETLVRRHQEMVYALCRRYLGSLSPGIEDVAQQVFIRIFRGRATWKPRAQVKTWIYQITVNACLNEIRSSRANKRRRIGLFSTLFADDPQALEALVAAEPYTPRKGIEEDPVAHKVRIAVDMLPDQQRLAVVLSRFHGCSYEEVAEAMGSTVPAVKSLLTRARESLRKSLRDFMPTLRAEEAAGAEEEDAP
jgi:RNA polymerase sigma-70 factor (ECF subfamily)